MAHSKTEGCSPWRLTGWEKQVHRPPLLAAGELGNSVVHEEDEGEVGVEEYDGRYDEIAIADADSVVRL